MILIYKNCICSENRFSYLVVKIYFHGDFSINMILN